jgi:GTP-binding protein
MIIKSADFVKSAVKPSHYPPATLPEIAFTGRSNVGKSSLINTLVNRKRLVKTSSTPGRTQLINFFNINNAFSFVDLPGFGYAKVPESIKRTWGPMVETYLLNRKTLKGVVLIMDIRRMPGTHELDFIEWLRYHTIPTILILTKADKLSKSKQMNQHIAITKILGTHHDDLILFSAKTRMGKDATWAEIEQLIDH